MSCLSWFINVVLVEDGIACLSMNLVRGADALSTGDSVSTSCDCSSDSCGAHICVVGSYKKVNLWNGLNFCFSTKIVWITDNYKTL